jgi:putative glycosyltransferase
MKIAIMAFGINSISNVSGMERVFVNMSNEMARRGHTVHTIWNGEHEDKPFYNFDTSVHTYNLGLGKIKVPVRYKVKRENSRCLNLPLVNKVDQYKYEQISLAITKIINIDEIDIFICHELNSVFVAQHLTNGCKPIIGMVHGNVEREFHRISIDQKKHYLN